MTPTGADMSDAVQHTLGIFHIDGRQVVVDETASAADLLKVIRYLGDMEQMRRKKPGDTLAIRPQWWAR